jgi:hypothetical protein
MMSTIGNDGLFMPPPDAGLGGLAGGSPQLLGPLAPPWPGSAPDGVGGPPGVLGFPTQTPPGIGSASAGGGPLGALMAQFLGALAGLFSAIAQAFGQTGGAGPGPGPGQTFYRSAQASSVGDPHDAFAGAPGAGNPVSGQWDDVHAHGDLLSSDSFGGGYRVSTQTSPPNQKGVTLNGSAAVTTQGGNAAVTLDAGGDVSVVAGGRSVALQPGATLALGGGESVTRNADGSVTVTGAAANGGSLETTLRANGSGGVDVTAHASNVDLGGYLVDREEDPVEPTPRGL